MARDIKNYRKTGVDVTVYHNVQEHEEESFATYLKPKNIVTVFQDNKDTETYLEKLCGKVPKSNRMTYFSYAGPKEKSKKISIKLGSPIDNTRVTSAGIVFGILNDDFKHLKLNQNQIAAAKSYKNIHDYVCAEFSMNDLLTSMPKPIITHLIFSIKGDKLNLTPKKMGLTNKYMTAEQLRNKVIDFLNTKYGVNTPIPKHFNDFFDAIDKSTSRKPQFITTYEISLEHISMIKSEIFEIFSAYDLLHRQGFKGQGEDFEVFFPEDENTPLYDYVISTKHSRLALGISFERYFVSVKNNISVSKIEAKNIKNNANKQSKFKLSSTTGNVVKPSSFFKNTDAINKWKAWVRKNRNGINGNKVVHTSELNNNRVYRIFSPVAGNKSANFTIDAIKNLSGIGSQNGSVGLVYTSNYFKKAIDTNDAELKRLNDVIRSEFANIFVDHILKFVNSNDSNTTIVQLTKYIHENTNFSVSVDDQKLVINKILKKTGQNNNITISDIQVICEKILEYNSKKQKSDLTAPNQTDNTNFVDIISYLVNRDSKKVIFSSAKYNKKSDSGNELQIYFKHIIAPDTDVLSNTWIPLRSKNPGKELLGLDLTFYTQPITIPAP